MANRVAFFASKEEVESYFGLSTQQEDIFEPGYNISPGNQLPLLHKDDGSDELKLKRVQWGNLNDGKSAETVVYKDDLDSFLKGKTYRRCIVPLSGFFIWKDNDEKKHPFFVRMLDGPIMSIAAIYDTANEHLTLITAESNTLIQPMTEKMPLLFNRPLSMAWLDGETGTDEILARADKLFLLTDLSVLKVSKKVNDPAKNDPKLIQPIPK